MALTGLHKGSGHIIECTTLLSKSFLRFYVSVLHAEYVNEQAGMVRRVHLCPAFALSSYPRPYGSNSLRSPSKTIATTTPPCHSVERTLYDRILMCTFSHIYMSGNSPVKTFDRCREFNIYSKRVVGQSRGIMLHPNKTTFATIKYACTIYAIYPY